LKLHVTLSLDGVGDNATVCTLVCLGLSVTGAICHLATNLTQYGIVYPRAKPILFYIFDPMAKIFRANRSFIDGYANDLH